MTAPDRPLTPSSSRLLPLDGGKGFGSAHRFAGPDQRYARLPPMWF